jgi:hypothetical protein
MQEEKVKLKNFLDSNGILILVTRVRSHGYVQLIFNIATKDIEPLGYRVQTKHSSLPSNQRSDNNETSVHQNNIPS